MKTVEERGRTLDQVLNPGLYEPFLGVADRAAFDRVWQQKPDCILANMAHAAYCKKTEIRTTMKKVGLNFENFYQSDFDGNGVKRGREAFLVSWDDTAVLSFRGTEGGDKLQFRVSEKMKIFAKYLNIELPEAVDILFMPTDLIDDLNAASYTYREGGKSSEVHAGFFKATNELWPKIQVDLKRLKENGVKEFFVTGHSLGAAMAVVAAMMGEFNQVVTFGEPSVGNDLGNTLEKSCKHTRYVNGDDPVTKIVPEFLFETHGDLEPIKDKSGADWRFDHSIINYAAVLAL